MDAGLTQPKIATQILAQCGHYLMVVKRNRRQLYDELTWCFDTVWCEKSIPDLPKGVALTDL